MTGASAPPALDPRMIRVRSVRTFVVAALTAGALVACSGSDASRDPFGRDIAPTTSSGGATGEATGEDPENPVRIKNLSMTEPRSTGSSSTYETLELTFVVEKNASARLERLQDIAITFGGKRRSFAANTCHESVVQYLGTVVTFELRDDGTNSALFYAGSSASYYCKTEPSMIPSQPTLKPWGESVTLELSGLLSDATPWKATATSTTRR